MTYCGEICLKDIKKKSKYSHLESKSHKEFEKYKHIILSLKNVDIKDVDEILYLYMIDHIEKFNHYLLAGEFKLLKKIANNRGDVYNGLKRFFWKNKILFQE